MGDHPVKVPQDLAEQLWFESASKPRDTPRAHVFAQKIAEWAADQELEACCEVVRRFWGDAADDLRIARRPLPPSLAEQGIEELELLKGDANSMGMGFDAPSIRAALNRLAELEAKQ